MCYGTIVNWVLIAVFYRHEDPKLYIRTQEEAEYVVDETLFRSYTLRGRGSTCWGVRKVGDERTRYIIVDSWVKAGRDIEQAILHKIEDARVVKGVAPLVHIGDIHVHTPEMGLQKDTIQCNRRGFVTSPDLDFVHTRTVSRCGGKPLEPFRNVKELLCTLHDAIEGV